MNLIIIGAQASGKMTIGQEIAKQTEMTLFTIMKPLILFSNLCPGPKQPRT